ncbi:hypothetical protein MAPG_04456 [Magnaporthiopsis poae ATCC 64411]|uniref:Uncharacterized protein n=1 Tax=Magnaporthiopsis poae (strain ATCC 64411 / 73-15) TaxID=644358 RepID=A0A0C4DWS6_MAGP6|nr:hypothetical protein MAPG_04456 [Magnaporthiopsis poae ATCC 64411]
MKNSLKDCICEACSWDSNRRWLEERSKSWGGSAVEPPTEDLRCARTGKVIVRGVKKTPPKAQTKSVGTTGKATMSKATKGSSDLNNRSEMRK